MARLFVLAALAVLTAETFPAQTSYRTIYSFGASPDGGDSNASLIIGPQGSLFGTTAAGGAYGYGTLFELSNPTGTAWTETVLYSFSGPDGAYPQANVVFGPNGALYGTTEGGGSGGGVVFELAPPTAPGGSWTETVLFAFSSSIHASVNAPVSAVLFGSNGILYSTAKGSNIDATGGVVALSPPGTTGGAWKESTIVKFGTPSTAGTFPYAGFVAAGGNMYGTNYSRGDEFCGGILGCGTVYELTPPAALGDAWTVTTVWEFLGLPDDGGFPLAPVTAASGILYGTTLLGGDGTVCTFPNAGGCGTVFQLTPPSEAGGPWSEAMLHSFTDVGGDGGYPASAVIAGIGGELYGTTQYGGSATSGSPCSYYGATGCGTVFELAPPAVPGGGWTETILHSFTGQDGDGSIPTAGLVMSPSGVLYGTTSSGGANGKGTVFAIRP